MANLDLDQDLVNHLVHEDSIKEIQARRVPSSLVFDPTANEAYEWQFNHLRQYGQLATKAVLEAEFELSLDEPQTAIGDLIERLRERYLKRQSKKALRELSEQVNTDPRAISQGLLSEGRRLSSLAGAKTEETGTGRFKDKVSEYYEEVQNGNGKGPSLGFEEIDDHFWGQRAITFVLAGPKTLKSWFVVNAMRRNIASGGFPYLYSLELSATDAQWRLWCLTANIPYWKYIHKCFTPDDLQHIKEAAEWLDQHGSHKIEKPSRGYRSASQLIEHALNEGATTIYIDQLQFVEGEKDKSVGELNDTGTYYGIINQIADYSDDCPITVVHQLNRSIMKNKDMPMMQQAKGSSAVEEHATLALGLWSNKDLRNSKMIEVGTLASRHHSYQNWHLGIEMDRGCKLTMLGPVEDEDDENEE